jgi:hypothetical protein
MKRAKVGWLQHKISVVGGAEMSCQTLIENAPEWAEVIWCPPNKRPPRDIDVFVIQNCVTYGPRWIEELALKPVIKQVRDPWFAGSAVLRRWILDNAELLIFSSPTQIEHFRYPFSARTHAIPVPVDLEPFRKNAESEDRFGYVFVGRADVFKGVNYAIDWALTNSKPLDIIGNCEYMSFGSLPPNIRLVGRQEYEWVAERLGKAVGYVAFPVWVEAFGRSVVEAWASGCEIILDADSRIGAIWWIENEPERLGYEGPIGEFWNDVKKVLKKYGANV